MKFVGSRGNKQVVAGGGCFVAGKMFLGGGSLSPVTIALSPPRVLLPRWSTNMKYFHYERVFYIRALQGLN